MLLPSLLSNGLACLMYIHKGIYKEL